MTHPAHYLRDLNAASLPRQRLTPALMRALAEFCHDMGIVFPVGATAIVPDVSLHPGPSVIFRVMEFRNTETGEAMRLLAMLKGKYQNRPHVFIDNVPTGRVWLWGNCRIHNASREEYLWLASNLRWVLEAFNAPQRLKAVKKAIRNISRFVVWDEAEEE